MFWQAFASGDDPNVESDDWITDMEKTGHDVVVVLVHTSDVDGIVANVAQRAKCALSIRPPLVLWLANLELAVLTKLGFVVIQGRGHRCRCAQSPYSRGCRAQIQHRPRKALC